MQTTVIIAGTVATLLLTGLIWFVQVVHYPLFRRVGRQAFAEYEREHMRRTSYVVVPLMMVEMITAILIVVVYVPPVSIFMGWLSMALLIAIWLTTFILQVPLHNHLRRGYDEQAARKLVNTNWVRVILWNARAAVMIVMVLDVYL